jgi:uncharacterized protein
MVSDRTTVSLLNGYQSPQLITGELAQGRTVRGRLFLIAILFLALLVSCTDDQEPDTDEIPSGLESDQPQGEIEQPGIQVLLITGGGWHDYETQERLLIDGLNDRIEETIEWTVVHEGDGEPDHHVSILKEENWADGFDVVIHNIGFGRVTDADYVARFVEYHKETPAVLIHSATHSYRYAEPADPWFDFIGLRSMEHESQREFMVENVAPDHPIMAGLPDEWENPIDEVYIILEESENLTPLARAWGEDTGEYHTITWTHMDEGIRVFGTTLGHNNEVFEMDLFLDKIANGLLWAVEKL